MEISIRPANSSDAGTIATLVLALTAEICHRTDTAHFDLNHADTTERTIQLLQAGHYTVLLAERDQFAVGIACLAVTHALYAGGTIGVLQEFYVSPPFRSQGIGARLLQQVQLLAEQRGWAAIELCTPPLPEFADSLRFYQEHGLQPVGGRKMRRMLV